MQVLECPVCLEVFHDPRVLTCGHTVCLGCLAMIEQHSDDMGVECPLCLQTTALDSCGIDELAINHATADVVNALSAGRAAQQEESQAFSWPGNSEGFFHEAMRKRGVRRMDDSNTSNARACSCPARPRPAKLAMEFSPSPLALPPQQEATLPPFRIYQAGVTPRHAANACSSLDTINMYHAMPVVEDSTTLAPSNSSSEDSTTLAPSNIALCPAHPLIPVEPQQELGQIPAAGYRSGSGEDRKAQGRGGMCGANRWGRMLSWLGLLPIEMV